MHLQQNLRIDLGELKAQIVKRIGPERSKLYFHYLNRFLSQKLSKSEYDRLCCRVLGRENLPLHNQLIRAILKNACQAKSPPPVNVGPTRSILPPAKNSIGIEDGHEQNNLALPNHKASITSNGILPGSPRKVRSLIRERRLKDRPCQLGSNGKVDSLYEATATKDFGSNIHAENGYLAQSDYQQQGQHLQAVLELAEDEREASVREASVQHKPVSQKIDQRSSLIMENGYELEHMGNSSNSRNSLCAPLGIPSCSASIGGGRRSHSVGSISDCYSNCDIGGLSETETLRKRMEHIVLAQGLGGVSMGCANMLNSMVDVYMKSLIGSCVDLIRARSSHESKKHMSQKQQIPGKANGGMLANNMQLQMQTGLSMEGRQEQTMPCSISLLDFKVAMELNPQQLGEDWPLMLEKISFRTFGE